MNTVGNTSGSHERQRLVHGVPLPPDCVRILDDLEQADVPGHGCALRSSIIEDCLGWLLQHRCIEPCGSSPFWKLTQLGRLVQSPMPESLGVRGVATHVRVAQQRVIEAARQWREADGYKLANASMALRLALARLEEEEDR
jgi:hypothetical protein